MWALVILPTEPFDSFSINEQIADNIHTACLRLFDMSSSPSNYEVIPTAAIIVIGDDEAVNGKFIIRLFDKSGNRNEEEVISLENDIKLENWINNNLLVK